MNVTRAAKGSQPTATAVSPDAALEQIRARIWAAQGSAEQARRTAADAAQALAEAELLRRRLPLVITAAHQALRSVRALRGIAPGALWLAARRGLGVERARRAEVLRVALAERDELVSRIAERQSRARELRSESTRLQAAASALPRLLDEAAACLRRCGGATADALVVAEAGLEPVLRREADLDQAVRWARWAQLHVATALDRLADGRTVGGYREYFSVPASGDGLRRRIEAARAALGGVRDVLDGLGQALGDLGVGPDPLVVAFLPADLEPWFAGIAADRAQQARVIAALDACEAASAQVDALLERVRGDHAATRRVLQGRRAHWCALLRGE